jgi:hypothetical protein
VSSGVSAIRTTVVAMKLCDPAVPRPAGDRPTLRPARSRTKGELADLGQHERGGDRDREALAQRSTPTPVVSTFTRSTAAMPAATSGR